ncbi:MAG: ribosomal protein S18-alanine N-acetyltransferase [Chloroflexota bacterium]
MSIDTSTLTVRYMQLADIPEVMEIDHASFKPPWPERSYRFELNESQVSYMVVLEQLEERELTGWKRIMNSLTGNLDTVEKQPVIVGYGGLWKIAEEAHISTIASHPDYRGKKYGEILLASMVQRAIYLKAEYIVLEVRVSNTVAQRLYRKYGFETQGVKKDYYHHDLEDAYDMRLFLTDDNIQRVKQLVGKLCNHISYKDRYANTLHPRLGR